MHHYLDADDGLAYRQIFTMQTLLSGKLNKVLSSRSNDLFTFRLSSVIIM